MASGSETSSLMSEHWSLGTAGFPYNYGITAAPFVKVTFTCAGLWEGTAFVWKQGQRVVYVWTLVYLKLPFVKIRHISDILCADNAVMAQKWHKSVHFTRNSAGRVWHIVYVMETGRSISSHGQRKAAKLGYTTVCAWAPRCRVVPWSVSCSKPPEHPISQPPLGWHTPVLCICQGSIDWHWLLAPSLN